jgi:hypothetical protein
MRMRESIGQFERAFLEETEADRVRREVLRRQAAQRSRLRHHERAQKRSTARFVVLVLTLLATAAIVTAVMFRMLYVVMG